MTIESLYILMLATGLLLLLNQLRVKQKQPVHLLFAVFCGSLAMVAAQFLGKGNLGSLAVLVAIGTCATCNCYWLIARALFRGEGGVLPRHLLAAVGLGLLMITAQGIAWLDTSGTISSPLLQGSRSALRELITITSSTTLMLTFWEGCRGILSAKGTQLRQQVVFLVAFGSAFVTCGVVAKFLAGTSVGDIKPWLVPICATQIMLTTQLLVSWRARSQETPHTEPLETATPAERTEQSLPGEVDSALLKRIDFLLNRQQLYLQPNLKVADLARQLDVPEYRVSQLMREHMQCKNFNQYVNARRIRHARGLLQDAEKRHWPVLVVGLESGFASVGPFTRAFKAECGVTPGQFRQDYFAQHEQALTS